MEDSNEYIELNDPFLGKMLRKMPLELAPKDFTQLVMNQVHARVEPTLEPDKYRRQMLWAYGSIAIGMLVIAVILFAIWPFFELNLNIDPSQVLNFINASLSVFDGVSTIIDYLKESSLQITILTAIFLLFFIERLLHRGISGSNTVVS